MKAELEPTGERMIEDAYHQTLGGYVIYLLHAASYQFAEKFCENKEVLDLGCGSGYGSFRIANIARRVCAVDVAGDAIQYAVEKYARSNLTFSQIAPDVALPYQSNSFDVVLSFQVIEHVSNHHEYLAEAARVLKKNGVLVLITPDRKHRLFPMQKPWNRWHLREYGMKELSEVVAERFEVKQALEMGARKDVAAVELNRYQVLKWITLPVTLPFLPEIFRRTTLDWIHRIRDVFKSKKQLQAADGASFPFGVEVVELSEKSETSMNIVIVATPK